MSDNNIFINGKKQAIEILQGLSSKERNLIIQNLSVKNPSLAKDLSYQTYNFNNILELEDSSIQKIFEYCSAAVIAVSIFPLSDEVKRRVLQIIPREKAKEVFRIYKTQPVSQQDSKKAQEKVLHIYSEINKL
jgi:flagellar motor switch protein FliG